MKKNLAAALLLTAGFSMSAHAGMISGPVTFDGGKPLNLQGLEWMPLNYTVGLSRIDVEGGFSDATKQWGNGGWRYATRNETVLLLNSLWGGRYDGSSHDNYAGAAAFIELFGVTYSPNASTSYANFFFGAAGDCYHISEFSCLGGVGVGVAGARGAIARELINGVWKSSISAAPWQKIGRLTSERWVDTGLVQTRYVSHFSLSSSEVASLLVRSVDAPVATVSSPATLSLFALGLCGLLLRCRKIAA